MLSLIYIFMIVTVGAAYKEMPFYIIPVEFLHNTCTHLKPLAYTPDNITYTCHTRHNTLLTR